MQKDVKVRKTIRISTKTKDQLKNLMTSGQWLKESELIRQALNMGLYQIKKDMDSKRVAE